MDLKNKEISISTARRWLKKSGLSIIDKNWKFLKQGSLIKLLKEEIAAERKEG